ncbi:hypothetical protein F4782DRAFT_407758 [Xylaria castorea]|nr:hypothetical protein F4782DRAFT_407758 [Xylaria castorea]
MKFPFNQSHTAMTFLLLLRPAFKVSTSRLFIHDMMKLRCRSLVVSLRLLSRSRNEHREIYVNNNADWVCNRIIQKHWIRTRHRAPSFFMAPESQPTKPA